MKAKDLILYQVATDRNYKVGDVLKFGEEFNGQGNRVYNTKFNKNDNSLHKMGYKYAKSKNFFKNKKIIYDLSSGLSEYDFIIRELATEEVRKENFPKLPSRLKCMFLLDSKEKLLDVLIEMRNNRNGKNFQAIAVKLNGEVFYAKDIGLPRIGLSYNEYKEVAIKYWKQNQKSKTETKEILFEGTAEVIEIIE